MAAPLDVGNLVQETSVTTGTGNQTLVTVNGKRTFNTGFGTGGTDVFDYFISNPDATEWERGTGHMSTSTVLVRDTVIESSNADAAVSFTAGTKFVTNDLPASFHGGQWNLLETIVASADASIDVTGLTSKYFAFVLIWDALVPGTDGNALQMRTSADNGATFDSGTSDYAYVTHFMTMATSPSHSLSGDDANDRTVLTAGIGNAANEAATAEVIVFNPSDAEYTKITGTASHVGSTGVRTHRLDGGIRLSAAAVNAVQFIMTSGNNIATGTLKVYGIRA